LNVSSKPAATAGTLSAGAMRRRPPRTFDDMFEPKAKIQTVAAASAAAAAAAALASSGAAAAGAAAAAAARRGAGGIAARRGAGARGAAASRAPRIRRRGSSWGELRVA
jgi:hypothetical protein